MDKKVSRLRRATRARAKIRELRQPRLSVHRSSQHIYAQVIDSVNGQTIVSASTLEKTYRTESAKKASNIAGASDIGKLIAERALAKGLKQVAFDRSGYKYHGRVKALADAARENGLVF